MKAPSPLCLWTLRDIALSPATPLCSRSLLRCYSSQRPPPPPKPLRKDHEPTIHQPAPEPGFITRRRSDDDEDHIPRPLSRPIGLPNPPRPGENHGTDDRSVKQRRDDFHNFDKHLAKRAKMTKQIAKPYFRDWSNMRFSKGKVFVAPERIFRSDIALFFPNLFGRILRKGAEKREGNGFGGLGRDTVEIMAGKVSVVTLVSNDWAARQVETFCGKQDNPAIDELLGQHADVAQKVEINHENNPLKYWILRFFGMGLLRKARSPEQQERYFVVRKGVSEVIKEAIGLLNDKGGYVYLLDGACRIRWAGSANAEQSEKDSMVRGLQRLILEARVERGERSDTNKELQDAVAQAIKEEEPAIKAAAAA